MTRPDRQVKQAREKREKRDRDEKVLRIDVEPALLDVLTQEPIPYKQGVGGEFTVGDAILICMQRELGPPLDRLTDDDKTHAFKIMDAVAEAMRKPEGERIVELATKDTDFAKKRSGILLPAMEHGLLCRYLDDYALVHGSTADTEDGDPDMVGPTD